MASKYIDALKQALDHSLEEEADCSERIQAAASQITELEGRIEECNARLKTVAADRDKILEIMQRYTTSDAVKEASSVPEATKPEAPAAKAAPKVETKSSEKTKPRVEAPPAKGQPAAKAEEKPAEEEDETVKNINDALRGLFR